MELPVGSRRRFCSSFVSVCFCSSFVSVSVEAQQRLRSVGLHLSTPPFHHTPWGLFRALLHVPITKYKLIPNPNPNPNTKMTVNTILIYIFCLFSTLYCVLLFYYCNKLYNNEICCSYIHASKNECIYFYYFQYTSTIHAYAKSTYVMYVIRNNDM